MQQFQVVIPRDQWHNFKGPHTATEIFCDCDTAVKDFFLKNFRLWFGPVQRALPGPAPRSNCTECKIVKSKPVNSKAQFDVRGFALYKSTLMQRAFLSIKMQTAVQHSTETNTFCAQHNALTEESRCHWPTGTDSHRLTQTQSSGGKATSIIMVHVTGPVIES